MGEKGFGWEEKECPQPSSSVSKINDSCYSRSSERSPTGGGAETPREEVGAVNELVRILVECLGKIRTREREVVLRKLFSELEREASMERFIIERLRRSEVGAISELLQRLQENIVNVGQSDRLSSIATRSLHDQVDEFTQKLDRFKIKTLHLGGGLAGDKNK